MNDLQIQFEHDAGDLFFDILLLVMLGLCLLALVGIYYDKRRRDKKLVPLRVSGRDAMRSMHQHQRHVVRRQRISSPERSHKTTH